MGMIINIDSALDNRADYNVLREPINDMLKNKQEAWEKQNPIDLLFKRGTINKFQETYTDSIGFAHAFKETGDYNVAPIFNTNEGFSTIYTTRTFQGGFIITQQVLEDANYANVKDTADKFLKRWHGDQVEYAMTAVSAGFGVAKNFGEDDNLTPLKLVSADTQTGEITDANKQFLFSAYHYPVKRKGMASATVAGMKQSNLFAVSEGGSYGIDFGTDPLAIAKLADIVNLVITEMENYKDDNGKYAGVSGQKTIVCPNEARLVGALNAAVSMESFKDCGLNPALGKATVESSPYLRGIPQCYSNGKGVGFFIVDKAYNSENHGLEFTERVALTMNVNATKNPYGISYDARQRFDINVATWRGIAFVYIGSDVATSTEFASRGYNSGSTAAEDKSGADRFTPLTPSVLLVKPVTVVGTVNTKATT